MAMGDLCNGICCFVAKEKQPAPATARFFVVSHQLLSQSPLTNTIYLLSEMLPKKRLKNTVFEPTQAALCSSTSTQLMLSHAMDSHQH